MTSPAIIHPPLLHALLLARQPLPAEVLAMQAGLPLLQLPRELDRLRGAGCTLDEHPQLGVSLIHEGIASWFDYLTNQPAQASRNRLVEVYQKISSTQDAARRLAEARGEEADAAVVTTWEQTAGRGRLGRKWLSPPGSGLTFSYVHHQPRSPDQVAAAAAVALAQAIELACAPASPAVRIKWPNDLVLGARKLGGILVESFTLPAPARSTVAIIGVGINVALTEADLPADAGGWQNQITSLAMQGITVPPLRILGEALMQLDHWLHPTDEAALLQAWRARSISLAQRLHLRCGNREYQGTVVDLDLHEGLILRTDGGEIVHLPAATTSTVLQQD